MPRRTRGFKWDNRLKKQYVSGTEITYGGTGGSITSTETPPSNPQPGDTWFDTSTGSFYIYYDDGGSQQWVGVGGRIGATGPAGTSSSSGGSSTGGSSLSTAVYATLAELPLTNVTNGSQAFVSETDRLYIWADTGWYNIAIINTSPTITQGGAGTYDLATDGTPTVITLTATDPEGIPITWSYSVTSGSLSNGGGTTATVSQADNVFTITPTTTQDYAGSFQLTFTASDGVNLATDTNSFSLVFVTLVQNSNYTTSLITTDGSTGNNTAFVDSSTNGATITASGDPKLTTYSPYRDGGYSVKIDSTGNDWIYANSHSDFNFGTGDFTVEFWMKSQKSDQWLLLIDQQYQAQGISIWINPTNQLVYYPNSSTPALTSQALPMTDWIHVALVRSSGTTKFYVNGVWNSTSYSDSQNFNTNLPIKIGSDYNQGPYGYIGYFRDVRVTNTAVYSSDFTPPTEPLTAISGTKLLTCQSLTFKDESSSNHTITVTGYPNIVPYGPYDYDAFNSSVQGGSVYFDGSSTLSMAQNISSIGTGDFTLECWIKTSTVVNYQCPISCFDGTRGPWIHTTNTGVLIGSDYGGSYAQGSIYVCDNHWHHVAMVRSGSTLTLYVDGIADGTLTHQEDFSTLTADIYLGDLNGYNRKFTGFVADAKITNSAVYTNTFTPATEQTSSTGTLLHVKGTGANIIDKSQSNSLTLVGNTTASTTQSKYASSSIYFDGTGDTISFYPVTGFSDKDFTIEFWWYPTDTSIQALFIGTQGTDHSVAISYGMPNTTTTMGIWASSNGTSWDMVNADNSGNGIGSETVNQNSWNHIAMTRESGTFKLFVNGVLDVTVTGQTGAIADYGSGTYKSVIGQWWQAGTNLTDLHGYIEDFRITTGLARYTSTFTPPTGSLQG